MKRLLLHILVILTVIMMECGDNGTGPEPEKDYKRNYKEDMRIFVQGISGYANEINPSFIIIPQNGHELLTSNGETDGPPATNYIKAIDGVGREDLFYGYENDNVATPESVQNYMIVFMDIAVANGVQVLVTDYCSTHAFMDDSYSQNAAKGYISFAANDRELNGIPVYPTTPYNVNLYDIISLAEAKNFLYLLNPGNYGTKVNFLNAIKGTDYDCVIVDLFFEGSEQLTASDVASLKVKANGASRLLIAYMSIGEAEDYRYYWQKSWEQTRPAWLAGENPEWEGNYKVRYWYKDWQNIIFGNNDSYLKKILDAGFDGVYLDIIDTFEYFENQ